MRPFSSPTLRAVADAVVAVATSLLIRWALWPTLGNRLPFLIFFPAILLCAYLSGLRGGLLATVLGILAGLFLQSAPENPFLNLGAKDWPRILFVAFIGGAISLFYELVQRARRRAEWQAERLRESESRQRVTLASIGDGVIVTDREGRITLLNTAAEYLTGWTIAEALGQPLGKVFAIFHEENKNPIEEPVARALEDGQPIRLEQQTELRARDGTVKPIGGSAAPVRGDGGDVTGVVLVFQDMTDRRRLERQRDSSILRHQVASAEAEAARRQAMQILESITDGFFAVNRSWRFTYLNSLAEKLLGRTREELLGKQLWEEFPEILSSGLGRVYRRAMADAATVVHEEFVSPQGRWYEVHAYGSAEGLSVYFRDATERRQGRETLSRSEDRYRCLVRATAQIVWTTDDQGRVVEDSPSWRAYTGQSLQEWLGNGWIEAVHPEDRARVAAAWADAIAHRTIYEINYRLRTVDGGYRDTMSRAVPVLETDGRVREWVGMNTDITDRKRAEAELAETRLLFQRMAEATPDILSRYDLLAERNVYVNRSIVQVLGYPVEQFAGLSRADLDALVHPDDRAIVTEAAERYAALLDGEVLEFEYRMRHADGSYRWLRSRDTVFTRKPDGKPSQLLGLAQDITRHKEAAQAIRESEARFRRLFEANSVGICFWNVTGGVSEANDAYLRMLRFNRDDLHAGRVDWSAQTPPEYEAVTQAALQKLLTTGVCAPYEKEFLRKDGGRVSALVSAASFAEGGGPEGIALVLDLTEQKRAEAALREVDRRKDEFLAMLGHELRNPLAPVRNALQILRLSRDDTELSRLTVMMERQIAHMVRLVEDLLDVSRISRGKIELIKRSVNLTELVTRTVETLRPLFEERQHQLEATLTAEPLCLEADAARLEQVLTNLLTNSIKYTSPGGHIRLTLRQEDAEAVLTVADNGIGIRPEMLPRIFDTFQQADRLPGRVSEGLGLGLTLVRTLTEMHGGSVTASSAGPSQGSEFVVRLPLGEEEGGRMQEEREDSVPDSFCTLPPTSLQVLVVDDNVDGAESLATVLRLAGHKVEVAYDGPEALASVRTQRPEVVLLDIGLPNGMDGYEVARRLRGECGLKDVLLVAVTGYGQEEDRQRAREAGFDAHLTKPVDFADLNELLREVGKLSKSHPSVS